MFDYPKTVTLRDGLTVTVRLLTKNDTQKLYELFSSLSEESRKFLYDDVTDINVVESWTESINYDKIVPLIVESEGKILADGTLHKRSFGPQRHVGRIRAIVRDDYHGRGVGYLLTTELVEIARKAGLKIISCTLAEFEQGPIIRILKEHGFKRVALIPDYLIDSEGNTFSMAYLVKKLE